MPLMAGTGPATMAGNLVVQNAEALSGVVLLELAFPGCPAFFAGAPSAMDLKTGGYTAGPEDYLLAAGATQLAHFYGVPMAMGTMATSAKEPDWQAAVDDSLSTFASVMTCADMMNGCGLLNGSKILSYPHLVMESEIYGIVQKVAAGVVVDDDTLAVDLIAKVGPNGTYLSEKHTRRHMKDICRRHPRQSPARTTARRCRRRAGPHRGRRRRGAGRAVMGACSAVRHAVRRRAHD
jgi:trimethylamine--corrinoid protein Co-methyltransferase